MDAPGQIWGPLKRQGFMPCERVPGSNPGRGLACESDRGGQMSARLSECELRTLFAEVPA